MEPDGDGVCADLLNVLFITHRLPYPPNRGDRIRSYNLIRFLAGRCNLHLAALADEPFSSDDLNHLGRHCSDVTVLRLSRLKRFANGLRSMVKGRSLSEGLFYSRDFQRRLDGWRKTIGFDAELIFCSSMFQYASSDSRLVVDLVDVDSVKWDEYANASSWPLSWLYQLERKRVHQLESEIAAASDEVTLVSDEEAELFRSKCSCEARGVSNGVDTEYFVPSELNAETPIVSFVGVLDYKPNIDGLVWFARNVWPQLQTKKPDIEFNIVGRKPTRSVLDLGKLDGVRVVGEVPDVRPYLAKSTIVIAPLQIARGIQNKVLEAMAMAKAVVGTPQALAGLQLSDEAISASNPSEWVTHLIELIEDPELRIQLGDRARECVENRFAWSARLQPLESMLGLKKA